ncbi:ABC transporter substrate-binding protein [Bosea sp. Root381]|uniref:substrate-binding periplasmic protein n=1 Tax=Bosea sp. Root381 TaxID=1736524 RepID=UPI0006FBD58F|nr:transporter substrate-binding domain-containing protein [Bosea sp. Root381]KRE15016.1 ABC transporter substrate-binding protein [Bosea sp. Root381]
MFSRRGLILGSPVLLAAAPAAAQPVDQRADLQDITGRGSLRVTVPNFDSRPFFSAVSNRLEGLDIDLAQAIASELAVEAAFDRSPTSFNEAVQLVARGDADLAICKLSRTLPRARIIGYSRPYAQLNHGLLTHRVRFAAVARGRDMTEVIRNFEGELGVIGNSSFADFAGRNFPKARLQRFDTWSGMIDAIRSGNIDAAYRDDFEIKRLLVEDPSLTLVARSVTLTDLTDTLAIGIRPDAPQLAAFVDLFLELAHSAKPLSGDDLLARYRKTTGL